MNLRKLNSLTKSQLFCPYLSSKSFTDLRLLQIRRTNLSTVCSTSIISRTMPSMAHFYPRYLLLSSVYIYSELRQMATKSWKLFITFQCFTWWASGSALMLYQFPTCWTHGMKWVCWIAQCRALSSSGTSSSKNPNPKHSSQKGAALPWWTSSKPAMRWASQTMPSSIASCRASEYTLTN